MTTPSSALRTLKSAVIRAVDVSPASPGEQQWPLVEGIVQAYNDYLESRVSNFSSAFIDSDDLLIQALSGDVFWFSETIVNQGILERVVAMLIEASARYPWSARPSTIALLNILLELKLDKLDEFPTFEKLANVLIGGIIACVYNCRENVQDLCAYIQKYYLPRCHRIMLSTLGMNRMSALFNTITVVKLFAHFDLVHSKGNNYGQIEFLLHAMTALDGIALPIDLKGGDIISSANGSYISTEWEALHCFVQSNSGGVIGRSSQQFLLKWINDLSLPSQSRLERYVREMGFTPIAPALRLRISASLSGMVRQELGTILQYAIIASGSVNKAAYKRGPFFSLQRKLVNNYVKSCEQLQGKVECSGCPEKLKLKLRCRVGDIDTILVLLLSPLGVDSGLTADGILESFMDTTALFFSQWADLDCDSISYSSGDGYDLWFSAVFYLGVFAAHLLQPHKGMAVLLLLTEQLLDIHEFIRNKMEDEVRIRADVLSPLMYAYQQLLYSFVYALIHLTPVFLHGRSSIKQSCNWIKLKSAIISIFNDNDDWFMGDSDSDDLAWFDVWLSVAPILLIPRPVLWYLVLITLPLLGVGTDGLCYKYSHVLTQGRDAAIVGSDVVELDSIEHDVVNAHNLAKRVQGSVIYSNFMPASSLVSWHTEQSGLCSPQRSPDQSVSDPYQLDPSLNVHALTASDWLEMRRRVSARILSLSRRAVPSIFDLSSSDPKKLTSAAVRCFQARDIFNHIIEFLSYKRVCRLAAVNRLFREHCDFLPMWRDRFLRRWKSHNLQFEKGDIYSKSGRYNSNNGSAGISGKSSEIASNAHIEPGLIRVPVVSCSHCMFPELRGCCGSAADTHNWKYLYMRREWLHKRNRNKLCPYIGCEVILSTPSHRQRHMEKHNKSSGKKPI